MKLVVLGLSLSSSWGNGHATTYRALLKAFAARGHDILFLERDVPWYAAERDLSDPGFCRWALYSDLSELERWQDAVRAADAVIVGSYVPDGIAVGEWILQHAEGVTAFYDIDTPITLAAVASNDCPYLSCRQIRRYQVYLSFTGGPTLTRLEDVFGSPMACALYCSVDLPEEATCWTPPRWDLSYLGTYSADRQPVVERLLIESARRACGQRFVVAGSQYPGDIEWPDNVERIEHVAPADHAAFYRASRYTLNVTRAAMIAAGHSPSVRLFEAAACGTAILSDRWPGICDVFGRDGLAIVDTADDVLDWLGSDAGTRLADIALQHVRSRHTAAHRAEELEHILTVAATSARSSAYAVT